jgi:hypothetical protein
MTLKKSKDCMAPKQTNSPFTNDHANIFFHAPQRDPRRLVILEYP